MNWFRLICLAAAAGQLVASGAGVPSGSGPESSGGAQAPVLRASEPPDSRQITLPGPPPVTPAPKTIAPIPPVATFAPLPRKLVEDAILRRTLPPPVAAVSPLKPPPRSPAGPEVAIYCQKQIGHWKESDAVKLLGEPKRQRPAYDDKKAVNGAIYAFNDPTRKYRELELDFDLQSGALRTVFAYPQRLAWEDCRRAWSGPFSTADATQGRKFYSYTNRHLDVLVDPDGKVISLGWY
jgi:hypothetical protein